MPYTLGVETKDGNESRYVLRRFNGTNYDITLPDFNRRIRAFSRTGTNTPAASKVPKPPKQYYFIEVVKYHPSGKRLAFKTWSKKAKRMVWAREKIPVYKLVRKRFFGSKLGRKRPKRLGPYWAPNALEFKQVVVKYGKDLDFKVPHASIPTLFEEYKGPCYAFFSPIQGGGTLGPDHATMLNETFSSYLAPIVTKLETSSLDKLYSRVKGQKVNLAQALAERAQTCRLLMNSMIRVLEALLLLKHGRVRDAAKELFPTNQKALANDYLAYQFGVLPLLSDIDGVCEHLTTDEPLQFDVIGKSKEVLTERVIATHSGTNRCKCLTTVYSSAVVEVRHKVRVRVNSIVPEFRRLDELGFLDPVNVAWELFPYSFIVDWFFPIGQYLSNMDAFTTLQTLSYHKTIFVKETVRVVRVFGGTTNYGYVWPNVTTECSFVRTYVKRVPLSAPPDLGTPTWKNPLSLKHGMLVLALLVQLKRS